MLRGLLLQRHSGCTYHWQSIYGGSSEELTGNAIQSSIDNNSAIHRGLHEGEYSSIKAQRLCTDRYINHCYHSQTLTIN